MDNIDIKDIAGEIKKRIPGIELVFDEPMKNHNSFKIGGNADCFIEPSNEGELIKTILFLKENSVKFHVIGNGSNILVPDSGIRGFVVCIGKKLSSLALDDDRIIVSSGTLLSKTASFALENSLGGFEFASGIPGSMGGAIVMNAGAYGREMKDVVIKTRYMDDDGNIKECFKDEHLFGYRKSRFSSGEVILSSVIQLEKGDKNIIKQNMNDLAMKRKEKQPLEYPSAGSTFKRPEGYFAAKLIDDAGLRGLRVGDAMVSQKHCGFVVNMGNATYKDVCDIISIIKNEVSKKFGVELQTEVKIIE